MLAQELRTSNNARFRLVYHLVLVTKYRRKVLSAAMISRASAILHSRGGDLPATY